MKGDTVEATTGASTANDAELVRYINLKLAALGRPTSQSTAHIDLQARLAQAVEVC
jgi:hypothetical protein